MTPEPRLPLVPFLEVLSKHRRRILSLAFVAALAAGVFALVSPATYEATLTILPPESGGGLGGLGGVNIESSLAMLQFGMTTLRSADLYADMLKSRSVKRYTIDRLDLLQAFGLAKLDTLRAYGYAFGQLDDDVRVETANNGLITVWVNARTGFFPNRESKRLAAERAAAIANTMAEGLDVVNRTKNTSQARRARLYLESQVDATSQKLESTGTELASFQKRHLAVDLSEQVKVGIETAGKLEADVLAREVALGVALQSMQPSNPEVRRIETEVRELRRQLRNVQRGSAFSGSPDSLSLGLETLPDLARRYALLLREVKVQETLYEMLTAQLYQARVKETEQLPVVQVLDEARVPYAKKSPLVKKVALLALLLGTACGVVLAFLSEWWSRYAHGAEDLRALRRLFGRAG